MKNASTTPWAHAARVLALAVGLLAGSACGDTRSEVIIVNPPAGDATARQAAAAATRVAALAGRDAGSIEGRTADRR